MDLITDFLFYFFIVIVIFKGTEKNACQPKWQSYLCVFRYFPLKNISIFRVEIYKKKDDALYVLVFKLVYF